MNDAPTTTDGPSASMPDTWRTTAAVIRRVTCETPGVKTYDLEIDGAESNSDFQYVPGQFNMLYVPGIGEAAISICGKTDKGLIRHTIRSVGAVTDSIDHGGTGMSLGLRGPFGSGWPLEMIGREGKDKLRIILVAGGIGLAPLRSVVSHFLRQRQLAGSIDLLMGSRTPADLLYASEYPVWSERGMRVQTTVDRADDAWNGQIGVVTLLLDRLAIPRPESTVLLTCGPEVMMRYVVQAAEARGIPQSNVWVALERNMNCAIGLCGHCQFGPEFVCKDGPVFRYDRIAPWLGIREL